jgi:hypothetical protein
MVRRRMATFVIVAIPLALVFCLSLRADPPQNVGAADDPFAGKILVLNGRSNTNYEATLEEVHLKRVGDQMFLVGKGFAADDGKGWYNGRTIWVPLNDLSHITEFEDRSDLIKARDNRRSSGQ